jgi:hypothetical protein
VSEDRRDLLIYSAAIALYIVIGLFTKRLLSWNLAFLYFVVVIEVIPRTVRRLLGRRSAP